MKTTNTTNFVHLHVHSDFSLCKSTAKIKSLVDRAEELGMSHIALTDSGNMFGTMEFLEICRNRKNPIHPIIGCEVNVTPDYHLVLLAENREGYFNLIKLCSFAYTKDLHNQPCITDELLNQYHKGLIALSGCVHGEIPQLILGGKIEESEKKACYYRDLFGKNNFYLEIHDQGLTAEELNSCLSQKDVNKTIAAISRHTGIPMVATNNVHYLEKEDAAAHDVLLRIGEGKKNEDKSRVKFKNDQFYFKTGNEMTDLFKKYPTAITNTARIAKRCVCDVPVVTYPELINNLSEYLPEFEIPKGFTGINDYLRHVSTIGISKRYSKEKEAGGDKWIEIQKRLKYELDTITKMGFSSYFLIVADYVNWARENDIPVGPGRYTSTASIVAYVLGIADVDPLKYDILFERFINPERLSLPDFNIDFGNKGRDKVIKYVTGKYGKDRVGQIVIFGTFMPKRLIKDVAGVLGIPISEAEKITNLFPRTPFNITLAQVIDAEPKLKEFELDPRYTELFTLARKLEGLNRIFSTHAISLVIGRSELRDIVPLFKVSASGAITTQYDIYHIEKCGLVSFDFLGLKTLDIIKNTEEQIRRNGGEHSDFNIESIPEDDTATFALFGKGNTNHVFLFESNGIKNILRLAKPKTMTDLIALQALYRPGSLENISRFINCINGNQKIDYTDPCLEDILKETYGIIVYHEQIMRIIQRIAGYPLGKADVLRRIMGKKSKEITDKERICFIDSAAKQGYSTGRAGAIFDMLIPFAGYSFGKSHATAYTKVAYQTAYLKANFPNEFMARIPNI